MKKGADEKDVEQAVADLGEMAGIDVGNVDTEYDLDLLTERMSRKRRLVVESYHDLHVEVLAARAAKHPELGRLEANEHHLLWMLAILDQKYPKAKGLMKKMLRKEERRGGA